MTTVTKYRCDHCGKEVEDVYLENGWLKIQGALTRSWGVRKRGREGDAQTDYIHDVEYCSIDCMISALDKVRDEKRGPKPPKPQDFAPDPFKPPPKQPWEDPLPDEDADHQDPFKLND